MPERVDKEEKVDGGGSREVAEHTRESEPGKVPSKVESISPS